MSIINTREIDVGSGKGGVIKSTLADRAFRALERQGETVKAWEADENPGLSKILGKAKVKSITRPIPSIEDVQRERDVLVRHFDETSEVLDNPFVIGDIGAALAKHYVNYLRYADRPILNREFGIHQRFVSPFTMDDNALEGTVSYLTAAAEVFGPTDGYVSYIAVPVLMASYESDFINLQDNDNWDKIRRLQDEFGLVLTAPVPHIGSSAVAHGRTKRISMTEIFGMLSQLEDGIRSGKMPKDKPVIDLAASLRLAEAKSKIGQMTIVNREQKLLAEGLRKLDEAIQPIVQFDGEEPSVEAA